MEAHEASKLINSLGLKPGWTVKARPWSERHESSVLMEFNFPAADSSYPPEYKIDIPGGVVVTKAIMVGDCKTWDEVLRKVLTCVLDIEAHEWREFLRLGAEHDHHAPFHPHTDYGMLRWAKLGHRFSRATEAEHLLSFDLAFGKI